MNIEDQKEQLHNEVLELNQSVTEWYEYIDKIREDARIDIENTLRKIELALEKINKNTEEIQSLRNKQRNT